MMHIRRDFDPVFWLLLFALFVNVSSRGEFSESDSMLNFIRSVDPQNSLGVNDDLPSNPCLSQWKGVKCSLRSTTIVEISLDNMNLSGTIDTDSLCKLPNLRILNLAVNHIQGNIPGTISSCTSLRYLNVSNNLLNGIVPSALFKLKNLRTLDISNNRLTQETKFVNRYTAGLTKRQGPSKVEAGPIALDGVPALAPSRMPDAVARRTPRLGWLPPLILGIGVLCMLAAVINMTIRNLLKEKKILENLAHSSPSSSPRKNPKEVKQEEQRPELVFFVAEEEQFTLEDLLDASADLRMQNYCSSLYKVQLRSKAVYAVKRLKKLLVSLEDFDLTVAKVGGLKHPNILPLVAYSRTSEEKLLIYKYQSKGSLLKLMESYVEGKRDFPWKLRLSIAVGIAKGLDYIYRSFEDSESIIPHGNIKLSNIMLNENEEPLVSEYGYSQFLDPKSARFFNSNGYTPPERALSEQGDVFSFGVVLLELLTGKIVENSGLDLPKWVKAMVREEWTGEVFDKEVAKVGMYAFPLLNISLKCVAHFPENRPGMAEVLEKIEEVVVAQEDFSFSSVTSMDSTPGEGHFLSSVAEESCDP